jgi:GPH family glycoside/pentoside/hexuronide:cation symporter
VGNQTLGKKAFSAGSEEKKISTESESPSKLSFTSGILFAAGDIGPSLTSVCLAFYWLYFLIEIAGISKLTAGLIYGSGYFLSAFASIGTGPWLDRNLPDMGSRCRLVAFAGPGMATAFAAVWLTPFSDQGRILWYLGWSWLFHLLFAAVYLAYLSLGTAICQNKEDRVVLNSFRFGGTMLLTLAVLGLHRLSEGIWPNDLRLLALAVMVAIMSAAGAVICATGLKRRLQAQTIYQLEKEKISFGSLFSSRLFWWAAGGNLAVWLAVQTTLVLTIFLCATAGASDATVLVILQLCIIAASIFCTLAIRRFSQNRLFAAAVIIWNAGAIFWWNSASPFSATMLLGFGLGIGTVLSWARIPEALELMASGRQLRIDASFYAALTLMRDFISAIVPVLVAFALQGKTTGSVEAGTIASGTLISVSVFSGLILFFLQRFCQADVGKEPMLKQSWK